MSGRPNSPLKFPIIASPAAPNPLPPNILTFGLPQPVFFPPKHFPRGSLKSLLKLGISKPKSNELSRPSAVCTKLFAASNTSSKPLNAELAIPPPILNAPLIPVHLSILAPQSNNEPTPLIISTLLLICEEISYPLDNTLLILPRGPAKVSPILSTILFKSAPVN